MQLRLGKSPTLDDLIRFCKRGKSWAQKELYNRYSGIMLGICHRYIKDRTEAEATMIQGFSVILDKIGQYRNAGSFEGWMKRIMVNESLIFLRKNRSMFLMADLKAAERMPDLNVLQNTLEAEDLIKIIQDLPVGYRTVFNLYAIEGYSHQEISEALKISVNTSKSQLSRARKFLQKSLLQLERLESQNSFAHASN